MILLIHKKINLNLCSMKKWKFTIFLVQGWEFAHWLFKRFAHFLWVKERESDSLVKKSESLPLLFCHERPERIAHSREFANFRSLSYGTERWRGSDSETVKNKNNAITWSRKGLFWKTRIAMYARQEQITTYNFYFKRHFFEQHMEFFLAISKGVLERQFNKKDQNPPPSCK